VVRHRYRLDRISVISGLSISPVRRRVGLYYRFHRKNIDGQGVCGFLRHLLRHLRGHVIVIWDNIVTLQDLPDDGWTDVSLLTISRCVVAPLQLLFRSCIFASGLPARYPMGGSHPPLAGLPHPPAAPRVAAVPPEPGRGSSAPPRAAPHGCPGGSVPPARTQPESYARFHASGTGHA
jgi:hypothetical protein